MSHPFLTTLKSQGLAICSQMLPTDGGVPDWIMIMPAGTVRGADGRGPYTLKDPQPVIAASVLPGRPVPADFDHQTVFATANGSTAPAAGWIEQMEGRDGALWAKVDWNDDGRQAIASKRYRYISPTFRHDQAGNVMVIASVALTNNPNLTELPAIASRTGQGETMDEFLKALRKALGLADDANQDAILQACRGGATATASVLALATDMGL
ncbi:phage protease, partial [Nitrospirillum viridazoti]